MKGLNFQPLLPKLEPVARSQDGQGVSEHEPPGCGWPQDPFLSSSPPWPPLTHLVCTESFPGGRIRILSNTVILKCGPQTPSTPSPGNLLKMQMGWGQWCYGMDSWHLLSP